jgi:RNA polymerase sigma-70 factor (ECF subfamily)
MGDADFDRPEFLALLRGGDERAYRQLIRRFHASLVGVASSIIGSRAQAEEVVQDAWLAVFSSVARFEGRSTLASWLFTIVLNRARTRAAREGRLVALPAGLDGEERAVPRAEFKPDGHWREGPRLWDVLDPERIIAGRQLWTHVQEAIARLPAGQQAVLILRDIEGVSAEDACALLQISAENQRVLLHRARGRIRKLIDGLTAAPQPAAAAVAARDAKPFRTIVQRFAMAFCVALLMVGARPHLTLPLRGPLPLRPGGRRGLGEVGRFPLQRQRAPVPDCASLQPGYG